MFTMFSQFSVNANSVQFGGDQLYDTLAEHQSLLAALL